MIVRARWLLFCFLMLASHAALADPVTPPAAGLLTLAKITDDPRSVLPDLTPLAKYAAVHLAGEGGVKDGQALAAASVADMARLLKEGRVDWVTETVFSALSLCRDAPAEIFLLRWKNGVPTYHTVFVARKNAGLHQLSDLAGRVIALEDAHSTSAYLIPAATLVQAGLRPMLLTRIGDKPPKDRVGFLFAGNELNIASWVARGVVDAGAYSNLEWDNPKRTPPAMRQQLAIFHRSPELPRAVDLVRTTLPALLKEKLKTILLAAPALPEGEKALAAFGQTTYFQPLTGCDDPALHAARALLPHLPGETQ